MKAFPSALVFTACFCVSINAAPLEVIDSSGQGDFTLFDGTRAPVILVESNSDAAVLRAASDLVEDFARVTDIRAQLQQQVTAGQKFQIVVGTLGTSGMVDQLASQGKLAVTGVTGEWESFLLQVVKNPAPGVDEALVIAGSDRRGTIYGIYQLSKMIGVSPWYWWADMPVARKKNLALRGDLFKQGPPGVKFRGIFINDEDWGMFPWAAKTFDPEFGNIGPKTYERVFELLLRLRLNYLWPAMHGVSTAFGSVPENSALADKFGIVMGSSHCEPMLYNNVRWSEAAQGRWNYALNRDGIHGIWEQTAKARGQYEAVWTLGIRGIHDAGMQTPPNDMPGKINLMNEVFRDQRELLDRHVTGQFGPVAQCFVPYKEVLPIYDAGLKVPDDVTLVWVDDNFGYIRRLSNSEERKRSGGAGVYWHLSYYGGPHSYTWINTTAPALIWEEFHKAWENEARTIWVINVGDLKPMEIGIDYFSRLACNPEGYPLGAQRTFLREFAAENFGEKLAPRITDLLMDFYRLGTVRKPELMERSWAMSLTQERANELDKDYHQLLERESSLARDIPAQTADAYSEMIGFPARVLGISGGIFMADRRMQMGNDPSAGESRIEALRAELDSQVTRFNTALAGGKWKEMMPGLVTARNLTAWNSQVRWPWGERQGSPSNQSARPSLQENKWRDAADADHRTTNGTAEWSTVEGLGPSGRAVALLPATLVNIWAETNASAPSLEFNFTSAQGDTEAWVDFLPTFRLVPGMKQQVTVSVDEAPPVLLEVPGSSGAENENGRIRSQAVQDNYVRARIPLNGLNSGRHTLRIRAVDPGVVVDRIWLP